MQRWDLRSMEVAPHRPEVLQSEGEGRSILIHLPAGESLRAHQVHERAWLLVVDGEIEIENGGETVTAQAGVLTMFEPNESREVRASSGSRLLLLLAPWPGEGHPSHRGQESSQ